MIRNRSTSDSVKVNELTRGWLVALKFHIVVISIIGPGFLGWMGWATTQIQAHQSYTESTERFNQQDGRALEAREREAREQLAASIDSRIDDLDRDTARILAILERVEATVKELRASQQ